MVKPAIKRPASRSYCNLISIDTSKTYKQTLDIMPSPATSSSDRSRCEYDRLHLHSEDAEDCNKRKREEIEDDETPIGPAPKRRRGRSAKTLATPYSQDAFSAANSSPLAAHPRYQLRSREELPTPEPSQQHTPEFEASPDENAIIAGPTTPSQDLDQRSELVDTIMVDNSTIANGDGSRDVSEIPADTTIVLETPFDDQPGLEVAINQNEYGTIVRETPFEEQPGLEVVQNQDRFGPFVRQSYEMENPFIDQPPVKSRFGDRLFGGLSDQERNNTHYTTRGGRGDASRDYEAENNALRQSRAALQRDLEASTALVKDLNNRLMQKGGGETVTSARLSQAETELAEVRAQVQDSKTLANRLGSALTSVVGIVAIYGVWAWVNGPEMQYIRKRRSDVLMD